MTGQYVAGVHHQHGGSVNRGVRRHGVNEGDIVHTGGHIWKEFGDLLSAFAVFLELPLGSDHSALVSFSTSAEGLYVDGLAVERIELGLVVESVYLAWTTVHKEKNDRLGLGLVVRILGGQRIDETGHFLGHGLGLKEVVLGQHAGQAEGGKSSPDVF